MGTNRRARQKANRAAKIEQEQKTERRDRLRQFGTIGLVAVVVIGGALFLFSLTGDDGDATATTSTTDADQATTTAPEEEPSAVSAPEPGASIEGEAECPEADGSSERVTSFTEPPPTCIDEGATYTAELDTTLGTITAELDAAAAPETVNNFVFLSRYHYYDGVPFHRIIPGFVIQGGDATGDPLGSGGPGYLITDEPPEPGEYEIGSLAMAESPADQRPGSQFFVITGQQGVNLPNEYALFGTVTGGLDVVSEIEALPTNSEDSPTEEIYINSVTITEG